MQYLISTDEDDIYIGDDMHFVRVTPLIAAAPDNYEEVAALVDQANETPFMSLGHYVEHVRGRKPQAALAKARGEHDG